MFSKGLFEDFTAWLEDGGRQKWTDATFAARLGGHELAEKNGVRKSKARTATLTLARRFGPNLSGPIPTQANVWTGVRFRTVGDE